MANTLVVSEPMENHYYCYCYCYYFATAVLLPCYCPAAATAAPLLPTAATAATAAILSSSNTSKYIILVVAAPPSYSSNSESPRISVTLDSTTYKCLWVKTGIHKLILIKLKDCPYNLFTIITKYSRVRNCLLLIIMAVLYP